MSTWTSVIKQGYLFSSSMATHGSGVVAVKPRVLLNHDTRDSQATSHTVVGRPTPEAQQWKQNTLLVSQLPTCKSVVPIIKN